MRVLWSLGSLSSQQIITELEPLEKWKPATIKTFLGRLVKKGWLTTSHHGKSYIYHPTIDEIEANHGMAKTLINQVCARKIGLTIAEMINYAQLSQTDIALLEETIQQKKQTALSTIQCNCLPRKCECQK